MKIYKNGLIIITVLLITIFSLSSVFAAEEEYIDPEIPDSWYGAPKTAGEIGIEKFSQSPMLDGQVERGELPSVEKRLPDDPPAVEPYEEIGEYGGTANVWGNTIDTFFMTGAQYLTHFESCLGRATPDGNQVVPYMAKDWEYSDDYKTFTVFLREGVKWSDGESFDSEDYLYWYEHVAQNEDLTPVPPQEWEPVALLDVTAPDQYTVKFHFSEPDPTFHNEIHLWIGWGTTTPKHYMKQFHPDFVDEEELEEKAEEAGLDTWFEYYERMSSVFHPDRGPRPTLMPYVATERTETSLEAERNPYYPFVDLEGNQLPYIDKIHLNLAQDNEMKAAKAATGEATIAGEKFTTDQIPMFKANEEKEDYETYIYNSGQASELTIFPNLTVDDEELKEIFHDVRFRKALSLSIDRDNINQKIFLGRGTPRQSTLIPTAEYYEPEFGEAYTEYDPEKAEELLDEMGMVDVNDDGYRERPDGDNFKPTIITTGNDKIKMLEMVRSNFMDIGINVDIKEISRELRIQRYQGNNWIMGAWHADRTTNILFPRNPRIAAPVGTIFDNPWGEYHTWYATGEERGLEPPEEIKELIHLVEDLRRSPDREDRIEAGKKLLEIQSEKLWMIGTVGLSAQPLIVSDQLKNVPKKGFLNDDVRRTVPYYPVQFYLED